MNPIDDMFRDGLGGRKGEVPADMWSRINAAKAPVTPAGEGVDQYFSAALKDRAGDVPADMWNRIAATGVPAAASLDQVFADGLRDRTDKVPTGMWDRIWRPRAAASVARTYRFLRAAGIVLFLLVFSVWALMDTDFDAEASGENKEMEVVAATAASATPPTEDLGSAAGAKTVKTAGTENALVNQESRSARTEPTPTRSVGNKSGEEENSNFAGISPPAAANGVRVRSNSTTSGILPDAFAGTPDEEPRVEPGGTEEAPAAAGELRPAITALPALAPLPAISALDMAAADFKVKRRYWPRTPAANSFRAAPRHRLQTEFLFGAFYANQQFSAETDDQRVQRNLREVRENPGLSYQVSLRGAYSLNEHFVLRAGLTYSEIRNKFDYEDVVNGSTTLLTINNHLRQLEVPVLLGLRIPGRRLNVSLNAGPLVNLTTSVRGRFLDPTSAEPLNLATDGQYRSNVGVGFMTSLSTTYVIGKKQPFVLLVEPFFKAYPGSYTLKDAPLRETYWAAGLQLGVRRGF